MALHFHEKNLLMINSGLCSTETACRWPAIDGGFTPFRLGIDIESYEERVDNEASRSIPVIESSGGIDCPGISCARRNTTLRLGHILSRCAAAYVVGLENMNASDLF